MRKRFLLLFAAVAAVSSCGTKAAGPVPVFDVTKSYPHKDLLLQDIATVEYVPLETKEGFLLAQQVPIRYMDDRTIITDAQDGTIMMFDRRTGRALDSFNRQGRGPGEYNRLGGLTVDRECGELFVVNFSGSMADGIGILVYNMQGRHLRTLEFSDISGIGRVLDNYDDDHLLWYEANIEKSAPYRLLSKTDTLATPLPVEFSGRDNMMVTRNINVPSADGGAPQVVAVGSEYVGIPVLKTTGGYIFTEQGVDTVYKWNIRRQELTPMLARTPAFRSMEFPVAVYVNVESSDYLLLHTMERKAGGSSSQLIYDRNEGAFYEGGVTNGDYVDRKTVDLRGSFSLPVGQTVMAIQAVELVGLHEQGKLRGTLAEIASRLKEDDNPVLMIATFK